MTVFKTEDDDPAPVMSPPVDDDDGGGGGYHYYDDNNDDDEEEEADDSEGDEDDGAAGRRGAGAEEEEQHLKKGPWTPDEDDLLRDYVREHGEGNWNQVRINAGLNRCGKSCRLRWSNHLRPNLKKGPFEVDEIDKIVRMHINWGNKWAKMATFLPGRTDNEIKNFWNTRLKRHKRSGLPIYPEYLVSQASNQEINFGTPEASHGTKRQNESSENVLDIKYLMHEYFNSDSFCKHAMNMGPSLVGPSSLPMDAMHPSKLLKYSGCITSDYNSSHPFVQIPDESEKAGYSTDNQLAPLGDDIISSHQMFDGNHSSSWTAQRPMKTELPSVQCYNYAFSNAGVCDYPSGSIEQADTLIDSPGSLKSESFSSKNTGLGLDAVVHKGDGIVNPMKPQGDSEVLLPPFPCNGVSQLNTYPVVHPFSLVPGDDENEGCPVGEIQASKSPSSSDVILAESKYYPDTSFSGLHHSLWAGIKAHDASQETFSIFDPLIDGHYSEEAKLPTAGDELDLSPWDSMPGACNMPDV